jgi:hypothetical protein
MNATPTFSRREGHLKSKYGLTEAQWEDKFEAQGRKCAACGASDTNGVGWHTDHNHETGKLRDILCRNCNLILGMVKDSVERLNGLAEYLVRHA